MQSVMLPVAFASSSSVRGLMSAAAPIVTARITTKLMRIFDLHGFIFFFLYQEYHAQKRTEPRTLKHSSSCLHQSSSNPRATAHTSFRSRVSAFNMMLDALVRVTPTEPRPVEIDQPFTSSNEAGMPDIDGNHRAKVKRLRMAAV